MRQPVICNLNKNKKQRKKDIMELVKFTEKDFKSLAGNIDSPLEMMIWAGPKYKYLLTFEQLKERMSQKINGQTKNYLFNLFDIVIGQSLGFIEIEIIDLDKKIGSIQSESQPCRAACSPCRYFA